MRIGMMVDMYKPHISGVTHYVSLNKRALEEVGHEVEVFTFGGEAAVDDERGIHRSPGMPVAASGFYLGFRYNRAARQRLQQMDIVHVHHPFLSGGLALRYCRHLGLPIVFTNHTRYDLYAQVYLPMIPDPLSRTFLAGYLPGFCRAVDLVIAPSEGLRGVLQDLGVDSPIEVVPNGVELAPFQNPVATERRSLGLGPDDLAMIYVGRLALEKNVAFLLRTFAGVRAAAPRARLVLVGGGPETDNLRGLAGELGIQDAVHFAGAVPYSAVPGLLAACDAFVTASISEVHPLSVIEAMAAGLPVVGIEAPGVRDTVTDGLDGFLSAYDSAAFSAKLTRLVLDDELRRKMGAAAARTAEEYDIRRTSARVEAHYRALAERPRPARPSRWETTWRQVFGRLT
jgi:glycosyltransferase involved in cell wall biosynthesis